MVVKLAVILVWMLGWCITSVLFLENFDYMDGPQSERGAKMFAAIGLGFLWPVLVVLAIVTSPVWGMVLLTSKIAKDRYQKARNADN